MAALTVFEKALNHAMLYEVGGFWNLDTPGARDGSIATAATRRANGYNNTPGDRGGETKYGIAKKAHPELDIAKLDWEAAKRVYQKQYWFPADCEDIASMGMPRLALLHFDGAVNSGISRASKWLQIAIGATPDGDIGPATLAKLSSADEHVTINKICDLRVAFYRQIVANDPSQAKFLKGWLRRIEENRTYLNGLAV